MLKHTVHTMDLKKLAGIATECGRTVTQRLRRAVSQQTQCQMAYRT